MSETNNPQIKRLVFDTYLAVIENSVGSMMFKNLYIEENGVKRDAMKDGWLSCAFYVSTILYMFKFIDGIHGTVEVTEKDLKKNGWMEITEPVVGSVIVWKEGATTNGHTHIGFYVGENMAISNDSWKKCPLKGDWKFDGKREVAMILWKPEIKNL